MSRSLFNRITTSLAHRIRQNQAILRKPSSLSYSSSASSVLPEASSSENPSSSDGVYMTDGCVQRMKELQATELEDKMLRLSVEAGGCSGFQYAFELDDKTNSDDRVFEKDGVKLVVDNVSYDFVKGATIDYVVELMRSAFLVTTNPSAVGGCSCKSSFMVKQ